MNQILVNQSHYLLYLYFDLNNCKLGFCLMQSHRFFTSCDLEIHRNKPPLFPDRISSDSIFLKLQPYIFTFINIISSEMEMKVEFEPVDFTIPTFQIEPKAQSDSQQSEYLYSLLGMDEDYPTLSTICQESSGSEQTQVTKNREFKQSKSSSHHNFQKHTVTTLKSLIHEDQFDSYFSNTSVMKQLWTMFLKNKSKRIQTKKFLTIFFNSIYCKDLKNYGFEKLFQEFQEDEIKEAQTNLKQMALMILNYKNISEHVENRKLQRKQAFLHYLISFRKELQSNEIRRRMDKSTSDQISQSSDIFSCLTFTF